MSSAITTKINKIVQLLDVSTKLISHLSNSTITSARYGPPQCLYIVFELCLQTTHTSCSSAHVISDHVTLLLITLRAGDRHSRLLFLPRRERNASSQSQRWSTCPPRDALRWTDRAWLQRAAAGRSAASSVQRFRQALDRRGSQQARCSSRRSLMLRTRQDPCPACRLGSFAEGRCQMVRLRTLQ
jgi:hypothetical protein